MKIVLLPLAAGLFATVANAGTLTSTVILSGTGDLGNLTAAFTFLTGPDGLINGTSGVTAATVTFTGNAAFSVPTFALGLPDLKSFSYQPSTPLECAPAVCVDDLDFSLSDGTGNFVNAAVSYTAFESTAQFVGMFSFGAAGFGPVADERGGLATDAFTVTSTPEPATVALLTIAAAIGLACLKLPARIRQPPVTFEQPGPAATAMLN